MTEAPPLPPLGPWVRWPLVFSLFVLAVRIAGELSDWDPRWFPREGGPTLSPVGIWPLIPIVGFLQGLAVAGRGHAPDRPGLAIVLHLLGAAFLAAAVAIGMQSLRWPMQPLAAAVGALLAFGFAWRAWPELLRYTLAYGFCLRACVVAVTALALALDWGTHLEYLPAESGATAPLERFALLASTQMLVWVPATVALGGAAGSFAALIRGRRADDALDE